MPLDKIHATKMVVLFIFFSMLAIILWNFQLGYVILPLLVLSAIVWLVYELQQKPKSVELKSAAMVGMFLMAFDFLVENAGGGLGLWQVGVTALHVIYVPIEIMLLTLIGGAAWALAQPRKFSMPDSALDISLFSVFGMIGEFMLIKNGIMAYSGGWTSLHAFFGYLITWCLLTIIRYWMLPINKVRS